MPRGFKLLQDKTIRGQMEVGQHADGQGLYLIVEKSGARRWLFLFRWQGKLKEMGLGSFSGVSLAQARTLADAARRSVASGENPIEARRAARAALANAKTFGHIADEVIESLSGGFRNAKHKAQWKTTLTTYAAALWDKPVGEIGTEEVLSALRPIWSTKAETASRVRGRIERVLDAARAKGLRTGENPARWRGHLDNLLSRRPTLSRGHHAAMPYGEVPALIAALRKRSGMASAALAFTILTAARTGEVLGARWSEIDRKAKVWTVPAARMKAGREHRVPLTDAAIAALDLANIAAPEGHRREAEDLVFPGERRGNKERPLSNMAMAMMLRRMEHDEITVHGFRSAFRDWAGNETPFPREIAEAALAHVVGDVTERSYRRSDALERRRALMAAWADFCTSANIGSNVVSIARTG